MAIESAFAGTDLKFIVEPTSSGFDKTRDEFEVTLKKGNITQTFHKSDMIVDDQNNYYICFSSAYFGKGTIQAIVTAHVPDDDFDDGIRDEVDRVDLIVIKSI